MKTVIDHNGCATYPYGSPSLEITVPTSLQGVDVLLAIKLLTDRVSELELKLAATQPLTQSTPVVTPEATTVTAVSVPVEKTSEPVQTSPEVVVSDSVVESVEVEPPSVVSKQTKKSSK